MKKGILFLSFLLSFSAAADISKLNQILKIKNAKWFARDSWVTQLKNEEFKKMLGSNEIPENSLDHSQEFNKTTYESIDWRSVEGINWLGDVMNQGNCGSCVAFATIATLESQVNISSKAPWLKPLFSPQALFACGGGACARGWFPSSAASYVKSNGVIDAACSPYLSGSTGQDVQCKQFCQNQKDRTYMIAGTTKPSNWGGNAEAVKAALKKGPLMTTMTVYDDFVSYGGGIYKSTSNRSVGGHAVSIVGFNDQERYWIVRNSWGPDWGEKGFVRISYDDKSGIGSSTIGFEILPSDNHVTFEYPQENDYASGTIDLKLKFSKQAEFALKLRKTGSTQEDILSCDKLNETNCISTLDTTHLADGKYELIAEANGAKKITSVLRSFSVLNSIPTMTISFEGAGVDLSKPLKDRIEFNVATSSSPVAIQKIDFIVHDEKGQFVTKRTTDVVLEKMKLGFRTNVLKNGKYEFFYRATIRVGEKDYSVESTKFKVQTQNNGGGDTRG